MITNMALSYLKKDEKGKILGFSTKDVPTKFYEMGILPNASVIVIQTLPFNGPIAINLNGNLMALRKKEAEVILIEKEK